MAWVPPLSGHHEAAIPINDKALYRKVMWHLAPTLLLCFIVGYLDRVNVGFAKLQMQDTLHFSDTVYGLGSGIFFLGYFLFEIPSNLILHKIGARRWIARIMVTWGMISSLTMLVSSSTQFYALRFLLGIAEAGFFPGIILYITYWFPAQRRGQMTALFLSSVCWSGVLGGPLSGYIMQTLDGRYGFHGWQWLFLLEGIPSIFLGLYVWRALYDNIADAHWLSSQEQLYLQEAIKADNANKPDIPLHQLLGTPHLLTFVLIYFSFVAGLYGTGFWLPSLLKSTGINSPLTIGLLSTIPYAVSAIAMILIAKSSDQKGERRWHIALPSFVGAVGFALSVYWSHNTWLALLGLTLSLLAILSNVALFWHLPTAFLSGTSAAAGIALINSLGNLAGFIGPYAIGALKDHTHSSAPGLYMLAGFMLLGGGLVLRLPSSKVNQH